MEPTDDTSSSFVSCASEFNSSTETPFALEHLSLSPIDKKLNVEPEFSRNNRETLKKSEELLEAHVNGIQKDSNKISGETLGTTEDEEGSGDFTACSNADQNKKKYMIDVEGNELRTKFEECLDLEKETVVNGKGEILKENGQMKHDVDNEVNEGEINKMNIGGGDAADKSEAIEKQTDTKLNDVIKVRKCRVKLPMKGEKFRVKVVDNFNVPHKLLLKNTDKVEKRKLNMLLAKKLLESLTNLPMDRMEERTYVLVKFGKPARLIRGQVKWVENNQKIEVQDIDNGSLYRVTAQDIFVLDDEQLAHIYPRLFVCTLSEFSGKDIYWNALIRDLYLSTLRSSQISIEVRTFHQTVQTYDVNIKLLLDEKKFINLNEWLANSLIPYLAFLKTCPTSQQKFSVQPPEEIFFPYVKLLKE